MGGDSTHGVVMEIQEPNATLHAYLADFTVNDARLKSTHVDFLGKVFAAISANPTATGFEAWIVTLWGKTSRTGSPDLNRALAIRRTAAVRDHLEQVLRSLPGHRVRFVEFAWEEEMAGPDDDIESEFHRSVEIWLTKAPIAKPRERRLPTPKGPPKSDHFAILMLGEFQVSRAVAPERFIKIKGRLRVRVPRVGVIVETQFFQVHDFKNKLSAFYVYEGVGAGAGTRLPVSMTEPGEWKRFTTSRPIQVSEFAGIARFTSAGALDWTWNYLHMLGTPKGVDSVYLAIDTGRTWGAGLGTTVGEMMLIDVVPDRMAFHREMIKKSAGRRPPAASSH